MSNKVQPYSLYEGNFLTTAPVLDRSVNVLMFRDPDNQEYNVIINRATLDEEQTPEAFLRIANGDFAQSTARLSARREIAAP